MHMNEKMACCDNMNNIIDEKKIDLNIDKNINNIVLNNMNMEVDILTDTTQPDYKKKTCKELIAMCKEKGIEGYSGKKKDDIVNLLMSK